MAQYSTSCVNYGRLVLSSWPQGPGPAHQPGHDLGLAHRGVSIYDSETRSHFRKEWPSVPPGAHKDDNWGVRTPGM